MLRLRVRLFFTVEGPARFLSQLDFLRNFERAARRAGLPLSMSEGYNPRPRFSFPSARPVGVESWREVCEIDLCAPTDLDSLVAELNSELPLGVRITEAAFSPPHEKARIEAVRYCFRFPSLEAAASVSVEAFLASGEAVVERREGGKLVDVRRFVQSMKLAGDTLEAQVAFETTGSVRPEEILRAVKYAGDAADVGISREVVCAASRGIAGQAKRARGRQARVRRRQANR
ncbi:MAG: TIGR03936 family radical SAM-associated protein [Planctomycetota bacterium]